MKTNISLIGIPGSSKSTVGADLAKHIHYGFIDIDEVIGQNHGKSPQEITAESGYESLLEIEEEEILMLLKIERQVISTGDSSVDSGYAMSHLKKISTVVYLEAAGETVDDTFKEKQTLYERYADLKVKCDNQDPHAIAHEIMSMLNISH